MNALNIVSIFIFIPYSTQGVRIIWDNEADGIETNEIDFAKLAPDDEVRIANKFLIYPGTKWCGAGNIANDYDDLGRFNDTDKCCRNHDLCDDAIEAFQTKYNLTNHAFYTRLNCECDELFHQCLLDVDSYVSAQVGFIYFNALGTQCFKNSYPIIKCKRYAITPMKKCLEYKLDETQEPFIQWFDVPVY